MTPVAKVKATRTQKTARKATRKATRKTGAKASKTRGAKAKARAKAPGAKATPNENVALWLLHRGYCLWLGAGAGLQLSDGTSARAPSWADLVKSLEAQRGLKKKVADSLTWPERLNRVQGQLGRSNFQRQLRTMIAMPLATALLEHLESWVKTGKIPDVLDQLALFGAFSNSVVNFNIETVTSRSVAAASAYAFKIFHPPAEGTSGWKKIEGKYSLTKGSGEVPLNVIHPHGAIDVSGRCVMTSEEYRLLNGTLGLELAVHSCFEDNVLILGMSLQDEYLRGQLVAFRSQIKRIFWICFREPAAADYAWALANRIEVVQYASPTEAWQIFSRYRKTGPTESTFLLGANTDTRHERIARRMADEVEYLAHLAFDVAVLTSSALGKLRSPNADHVRELGARLIWGSDVGEDQDGASALSDEQRARVKKIADGLNAWVDERENAREREKARRIIDQAKASSLGRGLGNVKDR